MPATRVIGLVRFPSRCGSGVLAGGRYRHKRRAQLNSPKDGPQPKAVSHTAPGNVTRKTSAVSQYKNPKNSNGALVESIISAPVNKP